MNVARWVSVLGAGVVLGGCGGYSSLGEVPGKGGTGDSGSGGSMGAQSGQGDTTTGGRMGMGTGDVGNTGMGATGGSEDTGGGAMGMGNVGNTGMGATGGAEDTGGTMGMGNVGNTGMGATGGTADSLCMVDADCAQPHGCIMCADGSVACARAICTLQCIYVAPVCTEPGPALGCPADDLASCDPGAGQICDSSECSVGENYPTGPVDRGLGVICKFMPDETGPDFGCFDGEWCQYELHACRCGHFEGCQVGERCEPCMGDRCDVPSGDSRCVRDVACTADNLDSCAAGPGKVCSDGALACAPSTACPDMAAGSGASRCTGAKGGCCAAGEWCFDDQECRCGTHPACAADEACRLDGVGFYACQAP